jgi:hypothetical protein
LPSVKASRRPKEKVASESFVREVGEPWKPVSLERDPGLPEGVAFMNGHPSLLLGLDVARHNPKDGSPEDVCVTVVMPTMPRPNGLSYVGKVVESIMGTRGCYRVKVMNTRPSEPVKITDEARALAEGSRGLRSYEVIPVPFVPAEPDGPGVSSGVGAAAPTLPLKKRQQTLDFLGMLYRLAPVCMTDYFLLMEDDFVLCPDFGQHFRFAALPYAESRLSDPTFRGLRIAAGLNGLLLKCRDVRENIRHILESGKMGTVPIDYLLADQWSQSPSKIVTYRYAMMTHIGDRSTVGNDVDMYSATKFGSVPSCYVILHFHVSIPKPEHFNVPACCSSLFSPCSDAVTNDLVTKRGHKHPLSLAAGVFPGYSPTTMAVPGRTLVARPMETCRDACGREGLGCSEAYAPIANTCSSMAKHFRECAGKNCVTIEGEELPAYAHSFGLGRDQGQCYLTKCPFQYLCHADNRATTRLCYCMPT